MSLPSNFTLMRQVAPAVIADDTSVAARIFFVGDKRLAANADPSVGFGSFDMTFYTDFANTTKDAGIGTAGVIATDGGAADLTFASLAATINASDNWRMVLVAALPSDLVYTHSGTVQHCIAVTAGGAAADKVADGDGAALYFDTSVVKHASVCVGLEADDSTAGYGTSRQAASTIDLASGDPAEGTPIGFVEAARDVASFIGSCITSTGATPAALFLYLYAATQTSSRLIAKIAGPTASSSLTSAFSTEHITRPGERLVARLHGTTNATPTIAANGGYGVISI